jgi:DNA repair protein RadC
MTQFKTTIPEIKLRYESSDVYRHKVHCSTTGHKVARMLFDDDTMELHETFIAIMLNRANNTTGFRVIGQGGIAGVVVDIRQIAVSALMTNASAVIVAHNHPSGNTKPSKADLSLTKKLKDALHLLDISLLDHLILTKETYLSFADEGLL